MNIQSWQKTSTVKVSLTDISQMQWKDLVVKINFTSCKPFEMQFAIKKRNKHVHYFLAGERKILTRRKNYKIFNQIQSSETNKNCHIFLNYFFILSWKQIRTFEKENKTCLCRRLLVWYFYRRSIPVILFRISDRVVYFFQGFELEWYSISDMKLIWTFSERRNHYPKL